MMNAGDARLSPAGNQGAVVPRLIPEKFDSGLQCELGACSSSWDGRGRVSGSGGGWES